ncbi:MAG: protein phosphatase 2C domain-containing protein [Actinomycetota bacterium]
MALALSFAARSDIGLGRYVNNQDSGYAGPYLLAVCDGMGGHAGGDVASSLVLGKLVTLDGEGHGGDALTLLEATLHQANSDLRTRLDAEPDLRGMGTTATTLVLHGDRIALAHIGDSRGYLLRNNELLRLTHDHTFVQSLVDDGRITEEEAARHPQRSVITRVMAGEEHDEPDVSVRETMAGDRYLLCSDGLTGVVSEGTIAETLTDVDDPATCAQMLVDLALRGGGADNITVIVGYVVDITRESAGVVPEVVGAAAIHGTVRSAALAQTPAAKAAALETPPARLNESEDDDLPLPGPPASKSRWALRGTIAALLVGLIGVGGYFSWQWSQRQYYISADGDLVAIYRGLPEDIGPVKMSQLFERQDLTLTALPRYAAEQVRSDITVDNLPAAREKVKELRHQACGAAAPATPAVTPSQTPTSTISAPSSKTTKSPEPRTTKAIASPKTQPSPSSPAPVTKPATSSPTSRPTASPNATAAREYSPFCVEPE